MTHEDELIHQKLKRMLRDTNTRNEDNEPVVRFKNYRELCTQLSMPVQNGTNSKNKQMKYLAYFCNIQKSDESRALYFTEVYSDPDQRILSQNKMVKCIETILLAYFLRQQEEHQQCAISLSSIQFMKLLHFVNQNYGDQEKEKQCMEEYQISQAHLTHFKNRTRERFTELIIPALNALASQMLIRYTVTDIIVYKASQNSSWEYKAANEEEVRRILRYKRQTLEDCGYNDIQEVWQHNSWEMYYAKFEQLIRQEEGQNGWLRVMSGFHVVTISNKWLREGLQRTLNELEAFEEVNQQFVHALNLNAERKYRNYVKLLDEDMNKKFLFFNDETAAKHSLSRYQYQSEYMEDDYLRHQEQLVDYFVSITRPPKY